MRAGARGLLSTLLGFVLVASAVPLVGSSPALAQSTELFITEYIEGTSNNKALEIFNDTGAPVDLAAGGYNIQMFFNGNPVAGLTINLTGTVADGDVFVLAHSSANATILAQADQTNGAGFFNGDDAVALRKGTTIIDVIGQIGFDPGTEWGSGLTSTADNTLRRNSTVTAGDTDGTNAFDPAIEWDGFATDSFDNLGSHTLIGGNQPVNADCGTGVSGSEGTAFSTGVSATDADGAVTGLVIDSITPSPSPGTITLTGLTPATGTGATATATIEVDALVPAGAYTVEVTATNNDATPQTDSCQLTITVVPPFTCGLPATPISALQGSGSTTPLSGSTVSVEGVVVGDYQGPGQFGGYYLQEEDADNDADPLTSEGVFVFNTSFPVNPGDVVRVRGVAGEFSGQTQLSGVTAVAICPASPTPTPATVSMPVSAVSDWESYEGMLVNIGQELTVTEVFTLARFGEVALSVGGRLQNPTNEVAPGAPALALQDLNNRSRILLDDGNNQQNIDPTLYPDGGLSASNTLRVGDTLPSLTGVLGFGFSQYRVQPVGPITFSETNPRPVAPGPVGGNVRVAAFNVLNYFNGDGSGGGFPTARGAESLFELTRQRDKIVDALVGLDADVVGLMELENDAAGDSAIEDLVTSLNSATAPGTYAFIDTGVVGDDEIRVGIIYQPATVTPVGDHAIIDSTVDERFDDTLNRPSIAQTFEVDSNGARFTAVVNHLKSKGSPCAGDPDAGDGQGNCNGTRTEAAEAMVDWLATDPTGSGDPDFLVLGDLNSYAMEDPITVFRDAGYVDTIDELSGDSAYSYVFQGQSGYLDHALASASLAAQVTGVTEWHINADEPVALDYNVNFKSANHINTLYAADAYRSSDHDPVLVGIDLSAPPTVDAGGPYVVVEGASVTVTASGDDPDDDVLTYAWDLDDNGTFETAGQSVSFSAALLQAPTTRAITVRVTDTGGLTATDAAVVEVIWDFGGFIGPIDEETPNSVKAGQVLPISFSLSGDQGLSILATGSPASQQISCDTGSPFGSSDSTMSAGERDLIYDPEADSYVYAWKTVKEWAGTCRRLTVALADGTVYHADFRFRR